MGKYEFWYAQEIRQLRNTIDDLQNRIFKLEDSLRLIAAPMRPDGTYNRCREACQKLAEEALKNETI